MGWLVMGVFRLGMFFFGRNGGISNRRVRILAGGEVFERNGLYRLLIEGLGSKSNLPSI